MTQPHHRFWTRNNNKVRLYYNRKHNTIIKHYKGSISPSTKVKMLSTVSTFPILWNFFPFLDILMLFHLHFEGTMCITHCVNWATVVALMLNAVSSDTAPWRSPHLPVLVSQHSDQRRITRLSAQAKPTALWCDLNLPPPHVEAIEFHQNHIRDTLP